MISTRAVAIGIFLTLFPANCRAIGEGVLDLNALLGIFSGMANIFGEVNTTDINIDRLMGKWHQMYKAAINFDVFQTNMYCQVAYLTKNKVMGRDGFSMEEAFHVVAKNGPIEVYKRDITKTGTGEFWMYTEEYFYPRQFYILKVGPEGQNLKLNESQSENVAPYEYLVATDSNRLALMVFAREPTNFHSSYDSEIQAFLAKQGFGGYVFWNQPVAIYHGNDCYYPSEQEVFARRVLKGSSVPQQAQITQRQNFGGQDELSRGANLALHQQQALLEQQRAAAAFNAHQAALLAKQKNAEAPLLSALQQVSQPNLGSNDQSSTNSRN